MTSERFWTIPNILSLYRIVAFPFLFYLVLSKQEFFFAIMISVNLVTDFLDGFIARVFKMQTAIGARLDSWADAGTYILAFLAIYYFKWELVKTHWLILALFFFAWFLSYVFVLVKFHGLLGLHTYLFKITGYLQGGFLITLFLFGFFSWWFYFCLAIGIIACVEEMIIISMLKRPASNVKGLYWLMKNKS